MRRVKYGIVCKLCEMLFGNQGQKVNHKPMLNIGKSYLVSMGGRSVGHFYNLLNKSVN
jgi:hypothetical protein